MVGVWGAASPPPNPHHWGGQEGPSTLPDLPNGNHNHDEVPYTFNSYAASHHRPKGHPAARDLSFSTTKRFFAWSSVCKSKAIFQLQPRMSRRRRLRSLHLRGCTP